MQQSLFFTEKKEVKAKSPKLKKEIPSNVFVEELKEIEINETFAAVCIKSIIASTLDKKEVSLDVTQEYSIQPYPQENSCFGGYWGSSSYTTEQIPELLKDIIIFRKDVLELPYTEDLKNSYKYTNLKDSNVFIKVSESTKKFIEENANIKWGNFIKEFDKIKNKRIPDGYKGLVDDELRLEKGIELKKKEIGNLKKDYIKKIEDSSPNLTNFEKNPNEIHDSWKKANSDLANLKKELQNITNNISNAVNFSEELTKKEANH